MKLSNMFFMLFGLMFTCLAFAQAEPSTIEGAVGLLPAIYAAVKSGNYLLAGASLTLVLVFVVRQYLLPKLSVSASALPVISIVIGILSGAAVSVVGGATLSQAALAMLSGPLASSLWSTAIKYLFDPNKLQG